MRKNKRQHDPQPTIIATVNHTAIFSFDLEAMSNQATKERHANRSITNNPKEKRGISLILVMLTTANGKHALSPKITLMTTRPK